MYAYILKFIQTNQQKAYTKATNKWCRGKSGRYTTLAKAQAACNDDSNCFGVYDYKGDNKGTFRKCHKDKNKKVPKSSVSSCVYVKGIIYVLHAWYQ